MLDKLEAALNQESEEIKVERKIFSKVYISRDALEKARIYANLARDRTGNPIECYGYLIGNQNRQNRLVDDVYFASEQTSSSAHTQIPASAVIRAGREIRGQGKRVLGWWHSHANFSTFHSGTDDENLKTVLNQIAPSNYINAYEEMEFLNGDIKKTKDSDSTLVVCDRNNSSRRLEIIFKELGDNPLIGMPIEKLIVRIPMKISYAYSIVVNAKRDYPYTELATRAYCVSCNQDHYEAKNVPLKICEESGLGLDLKDLKKEVSAKLILPRPAVRVVLPFRRRFERFRRIFNPNQTVEKSKPYELPDTTSTEESNTNQTTNSTQVNSKKIIEINPPKIEGFKLEND